MKFIPKYITTDILAEYGEHLTHEAYNEMVKLNSSQGDYNTTILNQLFNTDEGIQIPYLDKKIKEVTDDQAAINEDMEQVVADMAALAGSLRKYSTIVETRRMIQYATQDFVKTNKIKAGENVEVEVDALNNVIISATGGGGGGDVTKAYVDEQDAATLQSSKGYTDTKISQIPIPVVPTNISAFNNDVGYITDYTETDPIFSASAAAGITSEDITSWNDKSDFSGNYADLNGKPDLSVYVDKTSTQAISGSKLFTTIPQTNQQASENHHIINKKYFDEHLPPMTNIKYEGLGNTDKYIDCSTLTQPTLYASPYYNCHVYLKTDADHSYTNYITYAKDTSLLVYPTPAEGGVVAVYFKNTSQYLNGGLKLNIGHEIYSRDDTKDNGLTSHYLYTGAQDIVVNNKDATISKKFTFSSYLPECSKVPTTADQLVNKAYVDGLMPYEFDLDNSNPRDLLGLKRGLYIVKNTTNNFNQNIYYSPFRQGSASSTTKFNYGWFFVLRDITDDLPTGTEIIYYYTYNDGATYAYTISTDSSASTGVSSAGLLRDTAVTTTTAQTISGQKTFSDAITSNGNTTASNHLTTKSYVDKQLASDYSSSSTYDVDDFVRYGNYLYQCNTAITTPEAWDSTHWTAITSNSNLSANALNIIKAYVDAHSGGGNTDNYWLFDPNKQGAFGTTDSLHFLNCNRYQQPFVFEGKTLGMYVFAPMGFSNGSQLAQCFKGTSAATTYLSIEGCCFLVIVKDYTTAATEEDIAFGWGFGINGPMTFCLKKDTTTASGLKRTNMDYYNTSLYVNMQSNENIGGTKTFSTIPRVSSTANPTNIAQLLSYNAFMGLLTGGDYSISNTYNTGQYTRYNNRIWQCNADNVTGTWDATKWTDLYGTSILDSVINYVDNNTEIHYVKDSDLTNQCFILKGKTKGIYLFTHAVGLLYDSTNTPSQTNPEVCRSGILWLNKDVDPSDTTGGIVGAMVSHAHSQNGETYVPSDCTMIITAPTMPSTMSGVVLSGGTGSPVNAVTPDVIAPNYSWQNTYNTGDLVTYNRKLYQCNSNNVTGSWNSSYWTQKTLADLL